MYSDSNPGSTRLNWTRNEKELPTWEAHRDLIRELRP